MFPSQIRQQLPDNQEMISIPAPWMNETDPKNLAIQAVYIATIQGNPQALVMSVKFLESSMMHRLQYDKEYWIAVQQRTEKIELDLNMSKNYEDEREIKIAWEKLTLLLVAANRYKGKEVILRLSARKPKGDKVDEIPVSNKESSG